MRARHSTLWIVPVLALAGCGGTAPVTQSKVVQAAAPATAEAKAQSTAEVRLKYAWVRLRQDSYFVHPRDRVGMRLDIISTDKPVDRAEARWQAWDGRFDRWWTRTPWLDNTWTAPDRAGGHRVDVDLEIRYTDGTTERTDLNEIVWVR